MNRSYISLVTLVSVLALGGCSMLQPRPPEEIIADRALAQARHLMNREYDLALTYVVPSYQGSARATFYEADYVGSATWTDASVVSVKPQAVEPPLSSPTPLPRPTTTTNPPVSSNRPPEAWLMKAVSSTSSSRASVARISLTSSKSCQARWRVLAPAVVHHQIDDHSTPAASISMKKLSR